MSSAHETKKLIQQTLIKLLNQQPLYTITIADICQHSHIGRSTFYNHFHDKYEVLEEMNVSYCAQLKQLLNIRFTQTDITSILLKIIETFNNPDFFTLFNIPESSINLRRDMQTLIKAEFQEFFKYNELDKTLGIDSPFASELFSAFSLSVLATSQNVTEETLQKRVCFVNDLQKEILNYQTTESNQ